MNHKVNFAKYFKEKTNTELKRDNSNNFKSRSNSRSFSKGRSREKSDSNIKINYRSSKRNTFNSSSSKVNTLIVKDNENIIKSKRVRRISYKRSEEFENKRKFKDESKNYLQKLKSLNYENNKLLEKNKKESESKYQSIINIDQENKNKKKFTENNFIEKMNNNYLEKKNYLDNLNKKEEKVFIKNKKTIEIKNNSFVVQENFPNQLNFKNIIPKEKLIYTTSVTKKTHDFEIKNYQEHIKNKKSMDILKEMEESEEISVSKNNLNNQEKKNDTYAKEDMIYNINERFTLCEQNRDYKIKSESSLNLKSIEEKDNNFKNTDYSPFFSKNIMKKLSNSRKELPELLSANISENSKNTIFLKNPEKVESNKESNIKSKTINESK